MINYNLHHVNGLFFELLDDGGKNREYDIQFVDRRGKVDGMLTEQHVTIYETKLKPGSWSRLKRRYLSDIAIFIKYEGRIIKQINLLDELKDERVFIVFESKSLGDSIAWMPYCLEFQEKYKCKVIVSTFKNELFESVYPELEFVGRGVTIENLKAMVEFGWFWENDKEPEHPATIPLQKAASNIVALDFKEIQPRIAFTPSESPIENKYICISTRSTSQCKHWYYWKELIIDLKEMGYRVIEMSQEADDNGAEFLEDKSLANVMNYLHHAELFIGLSSGISWLNWGIGKKTIMISNFTTPDHEFQSNCVRLINKDVCNGCWNNPVFKFNKGDWNWCPEHEETPRHFECHKSITKDRVLETIKDNL
jgi:autotransporter strand-loop-strand O-heptosyltransferase